jgi:hypothetical protein
MPDGEVLEKHGAIKIAIDPTSLNIKINPSTILAVMHGVPSAPFGPTHQ